MAELTIEQQRALALIRIRRRRAEAQGQNLGTEIQANQPVPPVDTESNTISDFQKGTGAFAEPVTTPEQAQAEAQKKQSLGDSDAIQSFAVNDEGGHPATSDFANDPLRLPIALGKGFLNVPGRAVEGAAAFGETLNNAVDSVDSPLGRNLLEVGNRMANPLGGMFARGSTEKVKQGIQEVSDDTGIPLNSRPETPAEEVLIPAAEIAGGMLAGDKGARAATQGLGRAAQIGARMIGQETGAAVAVDKDTQKGLLVDKDGGKWLGLGLKVTPEDDAASAEMKQTLNLAVDNLATSAGIVGLGNAAGAGLGFFNSLRKNIWDWRDLPKIEKDFVSDVVDIGLNLGPDATREQRVNAMKELDKRIAEHDTQTFKMGEGIDDKVVQKDPVSILTEGLNQRNPQQRATSIHLESLRASAKSGNAPKTTTVLEQPKVALDDSLQDVQRTRGGAEAIDQTRESLQSQAHAKAAEQDVIPEMAKNDLEQDRLDLKNNLKTDEVFGEKFRKAEDAGVDLDVHKESRDLQSQIVNKSKDQRATDKKARDAAYDAIPEGTPANMDEWNAAVQKADAVIPDDLRPFIERADGSFKYLNNEVRPRISAAISNEYQAKIPDMTKIDKLKELRSNIMNDQIAFMTEHGNEGTIAAAKNANKANIDYSSKWNDGVGEDLRVNEMVNRPHTQPRNFIENGRAIVNQTIKDPNRKESVDQLFTILKPENEHLIGDVALAESMKNVVDEKDINKVISSLQDMANAFPETQKKRIEGFLTDIRERGKNIEDLKTKIPELERAADVAKDQIYSEQFEGLFDKAVGGGVRGKKNGYEAFKSILDNKDSKSFENIIKLAKENPNDMAGLQAAWAKAAEEKLSKNTKDVVPFGEEFEKYGKEVFGDNPAIDSIIALRKEAERISKAQQMASVQGFDRLKNQVNFHNAVNTVLTWTFGILNPTAARLRTITSEVAKKYNSSKISHQAIDNVLSSNTVIRKHLKTMIDEAETKLSPAERNTLFRYGVNLGIYHARDQTDKVLKEEREKRK